MWKNSPVRNAPEPKSSGGPSINPTQNTRLLYPPTGPRDPSRNSLNHNPCRIQIATYQTSNQSREPNDCVEIVRAVFLFVGLIGGFSWLVGVVNMESILPDWSSARIACSICKQKRESLHLFEKLTRREEFWRRGTKWFT
jgi:hypothetical protein